MKSLDPLGKPALDLVRVQTGQHGSLPPINTLLVIRVEYNEKNRNLLASTFQLSRTHLDYLQNRAQNGWCLPHSCVSVQEHASIIVSFNQQNVTVPCELSPLLLWLLRSTQ